MPLHEYICKSCGYEFEELTGKKDEGIKCRLCGSDSEKKMSRFSSVVSGSDSLDVKIGKDSEARWQIIKERQTKRRSVQDLKDVPIPKTEDGKFTPVMALGDKTEKESRKEYVGALQEHRQERSKRGQQQFTEAGSF